jgi:multicomponent Na+:H+ antiporter subunit D
LVSAFLASTATKVAHYLLIRFCFGIFGVALVFETVGIDVLLLPLSVLAMFVGSIAAIYQTDFKRLLAYSSIAQIGYMTLGFSLATEAGVSAGLIHVFNHALMKGALFLVAACVTWRIGGTNIEAMKGLGQRMPITMAAMVVAGLALVGVPGTVGFVSKWALVSAALEKDELLIAFLIMASSVLALVYIWKVVEVAYFASPEADIEKKEAPFRLLVPTWILVGASIYFGIFSGFAVDVAELAAAQLFTVGM